ncbi:CocE/NonD family hydrolase [Nocardia sp. NPDC050793]|uniref:CocE/NonD family hydrolase n=1 Tax=Nocardia sp. NPDC050793 TaxID=3155159 RepID=UPI0033C39BAC
MRTPPLSSFLAQRMLKLSSPPTRDVRVERGLRIPMRDGTVLLADRYAPRGGGDGLPTALMRGPYGRGGVIQLQMARPLAERGFQVLYQSSRGTAGSGGEFDPLRDERLDGLDTIDWICKQPWFGDSLVLYGNSYLGYTQWAVADQVPAQVKAIIPAVTNSAIGLNWMREDGFVLESALGWGVLTDLQRRPLATIRFLLGGRRRHRAESTLPLAEADRVALGRRVKTIQDFLVHNGSDPYWAEVDMSDKVKDVEVPASLVAGWFDVFLANQLRDYIELQQGGRRARLTVGPWSHNSPEVVSTAVEEVLEFGMAHARGIEPEHRAPVRVFVMGAEQWRDLQTWPPAGYAPDRFHLHPSGKLARQQPESASSPGEYRYDPADPTPILGGSRLLPGTTAGRVDNAAVEARQDVLTYISDPLTEELEVIGDVAAEIWFRSSASHADVFVRLCDVDLAGNSTNICDGLTGVADADELHCVTVSLSPTAYLFKRGHRIRIQVSSGAFPLYNRNLGFGDPRRDATRMRVADQQVHHGPEHASAIILPVRAR